MEITAKMVKDLRTKTGAGMMDCKKALAEAGGDVDKAVKVLREAGIAKAAKKGERAASQGIIATYIHPGDQLGVMVEINCETDFVARTDNFKAFAHDVAMHIAATDPSVVRREQLDTTTIESEREIFRQQALKDGKPENIVDKIVDGRIEKYYSEVVLLEQSYVRDNDKSVQDVVNEMVAKLGENIQINRFARFRLGG